MHNVWLWLVAGVCPHFIKRYQTKKEQGLHIQALFWSLIIKRRGGQLTWILSVPFIGHLQG